MVVVGDLVRLWSTAVVAAVVMICEGCSDGRGGGAVRMRTQLMVEEREQWMTSSVGMLSTARRSRWGFWW